METIQEQRAFFDQHWPALRSAVESGGAPPVVALIDGFPDELERRVLYAFARQGLVFREWAGKSFDPYIGVVDAGIQEMHRQAEAAPDQETRKRRINGAHILSYNLAADLADCWPGDQAPRTKALFERGKRAAEDCIAWCDPSIVSGLAQDWWVLGMHQISLGDAKAAVGSFQRSLGLASELDSQAGGPGTASPDAGFAVNLGAGYLALAQWIAGDPAGQDGYTAALASFTAQLSDELRREDAKFGVAQLETVRSRYGPGEG